MDSLSDLIHCCRALDTDKVTERKKQTEKLKLLLEKSVVQKALDDNTDAKQISKEKSLFAWDSVFKFVVDLVLVETNCLRKAKESNSQTAINNREKKKQDISGLVKFVVRVTDKRGERLKCFSVMNHIIQVLKDPFTCQAYGADYSSLLLKNILCVRKYSTELTSKMWQELISLYLKLYCDPPNGFNRVILAQLIHALVIGASQQLDMRPKKLFAFFTEVFKNIRQEKSTVVIEHLVLAMNTVVRYSSTNGRKQVCRLGEEVFINLLFLLTHRPTVRLKECAQEFLHLQLMAHHPHGARTEESGAFAHDWKLWASHLRKLYDAVYSDLRQVGGRNKFSTGFKEAILKPAYLELIADLCHQLFTEQPGCIEVTQVSSLDGGPGVKKRRLESGWSALRDAISSTGRTMQTVPWLQLLSRLLRKHPESLPWEEVSSLLQTLIPILTECKRSEVVSYSLMSVEALVLAVGARADWAHCRQDSDLTPWHKVWAAVLRLISLHHSAKESFSVMSALIQNQLITPKKDMWNLFFCNICTPTQESLEFLMNYLSSHDLPDSYQPSVLGITQPNDNGAFVLRKQLCDWLLVSHSDLNDQSTREYIASNQRLIAEILSALVLRDCRKGFQQSVKKLKGNSHATFRENTELQDLYLAYTFNDRPEFEPAFGTSDSSCGPTLASIGQLYEYIEKLIKSDVQSLVEITEHPIMTLEWMTRRCTIGLKFVQSLLQLKVLTEEKVLQNPILEAVKVLLKNLSLHLSDVVKKSGIGAVHTVLQALEEMAGVCTDDPSQIEVMSQLLHTVTPARLIDTLLEEAMKSSLIRQHTASRQDSSRSSTSRMASVVSDDFDLGFDISSTNTEELGMDSSPPDLEESADKSKVYCASVVSADALSDLQQAQVQVIRVLVRWCHSNPTSFTIREKLEDLLDDPKFDPARAVDVHIVREIVRGYTSQNQLTGDNLQKILDALRHMAKCHRHDQEVFVVVLDMLSVLIPPLSHEDCALDKEVKAECVTIILRLISAYWKIQERGDAMHKVRLALAKCLQAFIQSGLCAEFPVLCNTSGGSGDETEMRVWEAFLFLVSDNSLLVRWYTAQALTCLFNQRSKQDVLPTPHDVFAKMYEFVQDTLSLESKLNVDEQADEALNRTSSLLKALVNVACYSPVCEKKAVFTCVQLIKEKNFSVELVRKGMDQAAGQLGYRDVRAYLSTHLQFLVCHWLELNYDILELPHELMNYTTRAELFQEHYHVIFPCLFMQKKFGKVKEMCTELNADWLKLAEDCIPDSLVYVLPMFALCSSGEVEKDEALKVQYSQASACYDLLLREVTDQVVDKCIVSNLDQIVVKILMTLYDPDESNMDPQSEADPKPNPPYYSTAVIISTLDYLTQNFSGRNRTLVSVLSKMQDAIQNILLCLAVNVEKASRCFEKRRVLLMYRVFIRLLIREFHQKLGGSWAFVLREVIYRMTQIFTNTSFRPPKWLQASAWESQYKASIQSLCLDILQTMCQSAMEHCPQELGKYLSWIVSHLVGHVHDAYNVGTKVVKILEYLCVENAGTLTEQIASLDQFPDDPAVKNLQKVHRKLKYAKGPYTLKQEITHFLSADIHHRGATESRLGGLEFLYNFLTAHASDLSQMVSQPEDSPDKSLLSRLIWELVYLCTSPNKRVQTAASQCLGEIGPVNLGLVSKPVSPNSAALEQALLEYEQSPDLQKYCVVFHLLNECLTNVNVEVVQSASCVLKSLLATTTGQRFCADYKNKLTDKDFLFHYLHPFQTSKKSISRAKPPAIPRRTTPLRLDDETLWCPSDTDHKQWIITLVVSLLHSREVKDELLSLLEPVCQVKAKFCEAVLPYLIHDILVRGSEEESANLSSQINNFFSLHCEHTSTENSQTSSASASHKDKKLICMNKESVKVLLSVVQYLRHQDRIVSSHIKHTPFANNMWLDVDYLKVAKAAQNCSAFFTTILYTEIWWEIQRAKTSTAEGKKPGRKGSVSGRSTPNSQSGSQDWSQESGSLLTASGLGLSPADILLETYLSVGDPDGLYGYGEGRRADNTCRIKTYEHENQWDKAAVAYAVGMNQPGSGTQTGFLQSLKNCGSYSVVEQYLGWLPDDNIVCSPQLEDLRYEAAWRLGTWNLDTPNSLEECQTGYNKALYCALKAFQEGQADSVIGGACQVARCVSLKKLNEASWESSRSVYPVLANLRSLNQVAHFLDAKRESGIEQLMDKWSVSSGDMNEFEFLEPSFSVQNCLLRLLLERCPREGKLKSVYIKQLEQLASRTRMAGRYELAGDILRQIQGLPGNDSLSWQIEEANLYWDRGEQTTGKHLLKSFIDKLTKLIRNKDPGASRLYPHMLMMYGNWLADTRSDSPNVIMEKYLVKAVDWLESHGDEAGFALNAYLSVARYADSQYQNIVNYMKSSTFEAKQNLMKEAKQELEKYSSLADKRDRYLRTLQKQSQIDDTELLVLGEERKSFLLTALQSYIKCLKSGDSHDLRIFRVISLWFDNATVPEVNELIRDAVDGVKSLKFLPLMYQLAARMSTTPSHHQLFKPTLDRLIERTAIHHPYHTLFIILALAHANKDSELLNQGKEGKRGRLKRSTSELDTLDEDRVLAAKAMVEKLKSSPVREILTDIEKLCVAYIELANWNVEKYKRETKPIQLPQALQITQLKQLTLGISPTAMIRVDPACEYKDISHIIGFQPTFKLAGGVNLPKIITCICSDGTWSKQLVKGKDDLRQDAVMQQVFEMVNSLLQKDTETRQRNLKIRTYKVVPLSQRSGLLEWCEGTQPLGEYLIGNQDSSVKGAHARYRPYDLAAIDCRRKMAAVHGDPSLEKKHKAYLEVCAQFQPVFRFFFLEKYLEPAQWYERRLAYTKSVATNSIVGYILGLGDRHVQNILVDCNSAELIHIDLGVAFEQGHILPTPETVPFRLTRDIVDGMGSPGVEGVFRRCCEKTMEVMHQNQESLLTILQVLLYDPLYTWTMSPLKAYNLQQDRQQADTSDLNATGDLIDDDNNDDESDEKVNKLAERTLLRLQQKLQGIEDGVQLSVHGQVNHLIQEARDTTNLCKLFPGWQPYI
ncbi:serine-protein kinase ATM-like [Liolophura sinensis]|uniref:serine-protein kinase ATM-like n=1 Tax=Liolophura sinensis TaxID=3198878 RepID=UPI0031585C8B